MRGPQTRRRRQFFFIPHRHASVTWLELVYGVPTPHRVTAESVNSLVPGRGTVSEGARDRGLEGRVAGDGEADITGDDSAEWRG